MKTKPRICAHLVTKTLVENCFDESVFYILCTIIMLSVSLFNKVYLPEDMPK